MIEVFTVVLAFTHGKENWNKAQKHWMGRLQDKKVTPWTRSQVKHRDAARTATSAGVKGFPGRKGDEVHTDNTQGTGQEHASYSPESGQQGATQGSSNHLTHMITWWGDSRASGEQHWREGFYFGGVAFPHCS